MSSLSERQAPLALLAKACSAGVRLAPACTLIGLSEHIVQCCQRHAALYDGDLSACGKRVATPHWPATMILRAVLPNEGMLSSPWLLLSDLLFNF